MKLLFVVLLAGYAVSSDNNYYVIEMQDPQTHTSQAHAKKSFDVYWNVPTMQCASKKVHFEDLYEKYGIIQNDRDRFKGEKITILYDPGLFPALFKNESDGKIRFRNGGVPQEGNLNKHLEEFQNELDRSIPDKEFSGIGIIDFESWRPQFRQNFGSLEPYKVVSFEIERRLHWWWKEAWIKDEAKRRFEEAARTYMQGTLSVAKKLRPRARWGFYGYPYCFNMAKNNLAENCAEGVPAENDQVPWLWEESTALYPSVYSSAKLSGAQLAALVRGRTREAARCARAHSDVILPYFWYRYWDDGFLTEADISVALSTLYKSPATGVIIWGSSNDVNTLEKCTNLKNYVQNILGPAIAKYTKPIMRDGEQNEDTTMSTEMDTESPKPNVVSTDKDNINALDLNPEFHWMPSENITQNLENYIEEHLNGEFSQNVTDDDKPGLQNNILIDLILNAVLTSDKTTTTTDNPKNKHEKKNQLQNETVVNNTSSLKTSHVTNKVVTNNPLLNYINDTNDRKNQTQTFELTRSGSPIFNFTTTTIATEFESESEKNFDLQKETQIIDSITETSTTAMINTDEMTDNDYDLTLDEDDDDFDNLSEFILFYNKETTITTDDKAENTLSSNTEFTKNEKKAQTHTQELINTKDIRLNTDKSTDIDITHTSTDDIIGITSTVFQEPESITNNINVSQETTDDHKYILESSTIFTHTTEYELIKKDTNLATSSIDEITSSIETFTTENVLMESTENITEYKDTSKSYEFEFNNYFPTTPRIFTEFTALPNDTTNVVFNMESLETSKATELKYADETSTSIASEVSRSMDTEDTEVTSIVPSTEQVSGASQFKTPYMFCFIFYLYSVSNCLCSIFGRCP